MTAPGGRVLASTHGVQVYHPSPVDYWRWTHDGLTRLFADNAEWSALTDRAGSGHRVRPCDAAREFTEIALRRTVLARPPVSACSTARAPRWTPEPQAAGTGPRLADPEPPRRRTRLVRLLRRNALGVYAVYAAAILSGLARHAGGRSTRSERPPSASGRSIGAVTIYLCRSRLRRRRRRSSASRPRRADAAPTTI